MMVPDSAVIAEIMLQSEGFLESKALAKKITTLYSLMIQQLSKQDHYDFGLRAIKSVLNMAGSLKRARPDEKEQVLLLQACRDMNAPKFVSEDVPLFGAMLGDLFPGVDLPQLDRGDLERAIADEMQRRQLDVACFASSTPVALLAHALTTAARVGRCLATLSTSACSCTSPKTRATATCLSV